ncbi:MAG: hypothetical protein Q7S46_07995 [Gallionella sp.]|nr:hypothetical protein [Gallionella sp.]
MHKIKQASLFLFFAGIFAGFIPPPLADAKDLPALQSGATYAREDMNKAKAEHEKNDQEVARLQQIVEVQKKKLAEENQRLEEAKNNAIASQKRYLEAQKKYEKIQSALDEAWSKK